MNCTHSECGDSYSVKRFQSSQLSDFLKWLWLWLCLEFLLAKLWIRSHLWQKLFHHETYFIIHSTFAEYEQRITFPSSNLTCFHFNLRHSSNAIEINTNLYHVNDDVITSPLHRRVKHNSYTGTVSMTLWLSWCDVTIVGHDHRM